MNDRIITTTRRGLFEILAAGGSLAALGLPRSARAQSRGNVLVIGMDISDNATLDPAVASSGPSYPPIIKLAYDMLVTLSPDDMINVKPALASAWARTPDGRGLRFTLREGVTFNSGNPVTAEDVKWSFDRVMNVKSQPSLYVANIDSIRVVDDRTVDILLKDPRRPILNVICYVNFPVYDRKVLQAHGGDASADAQHKDKAGEWLNQNSCGTGPYTQVRWDRGTSIQYERNPHYWGPAPAFQRVIIRHLPDPAAQLLAIQRGDIDLAFNLVPEQLAMLKQSSDVRVDPLQGLALVYVALTCSADFNKALAVREARQAVAWAIDYEGIKNNLLSGSAQLPASILPIGVLGSTPEIARQHGFREDLDKSRALLAKAGFPNGFTFKMSYGNALIAGISYGVIAQKMQSDLARVGIRMELDPQDPVTIRTQYNTGKSTAVIQLWNPSGTDNWVWAMATTQRLAVRMHWTPPEDMVQLVDDGNTEPDQEKQRQIWVQYQKRMNDEAYLWPLFQQTNQIAVRRRLKPFPMTAASWYFDVTDIAV